MADLAVGLSKTVVEGALARVQTVIEEEAKLRQKAQRDLVLISLEFEMMQSFLNVANDEMNITKNNLVRTWVRHVRELAYDLEDCVEFVVHLDGKPVFWRRLLPSCIAPVLPLDQAVAEIEDLKGRAKELSKSYMRYSHIANDPAGSKLVMLQQQPAIRAASATASSVISVARDAARRRLGLGDLTQLITNNPRLHVISVWGTGGDYGTTSIIRKAYNDPEISKNFACRSWVQLMHPFNPREFVRRFMAQVYANTCEQEDAHVGVHVLTKMEANEEDLLNEFVEQVNSKTYVVVLENLTDMVDWDAVRTFLPDKENGSCIIVSTQQFEIASLCIGNFYQPLELKQFSPEHSVCALFKEEDMGDQSAREYYDIVSKTFASEDDAFEFYNSYALEKGFSVRKSYVEWDEANQEIILRKLVCSRQGSREEKHMKREDRKRRPRHLTRVGCRSKLVIAKLKETDRWFVKDFIDEHTHPLAPPDLACLMRSHRRISDEQKADIVEMEISGIRKHKIMDILMMQYGGYDEVGCTTRDIYNFCNQYKQETVAAGDAKTVISHMMARQERDPDFFFKYLVDREGHLKGLFWADSQSRRDYEAFGDVVVFDSTYRTNKYNLPFVPFVGLNHHRSTVIFGCGIISHETGEAYEWMLRTFSKAMANKHPISVITDGDLAMQRAIRVVWSDTVHKLCVWHIQENIVRHLSDDAVKEEFRSFIYDRSSIQEHESKWVDFLERNKVTSEESWLHQMYKMRKLWCAPYLVGRCFLGLSSNQRSESLNSVLHTHLDGSMTLFKMVEHYERCLSTRRLNEAVLDIVALQSVPFTEVDASSLEKHAAQVFTPAMFVLVRYSTDAVRNCTLSGEILDTDDLTTFVVAKKHRGEKFQVEYEKKEGCSERISCSCRKLECLGTPCSHIFYILGLLEVKRLPSCCVPIRWTMSAKATCPGTRKSCMYDYSASLRRYRELRNLSHAKCFSAAQSVEAYEHLKMVLNVQDDWKESSSGHKECMRYGPVLPQTARLDSGELEKVLDPVHVQGRGAPKKRLKKKRKRSNSKCGYCRLEGHNRRKCAKWIEDNNLTEPC